jgi:excisionase family DNA binding protein
MRQVESRTNDYDAEDSEVDVESGRTTMNQSAHAHPEPYVSPEDAAAFLKINRLKIIRMARSGAVPAHPIGTTKRRQWRFRLSELDRYMQGDVETKHPPVRQ